VSVTVDGIEDFEAAVARSLGAFVSQTTPLDSVVAAIAGRYADRLDSAIVAGVAGPYRAHTIAFHRSDRRPE
jgi:hypothetical protein